MEQIRRNKRRRFLICTLTAFLLVLGVRAVTLQAVYSREDAVHIDPKEVENATLIIGTHLISLRALNEKLYEIASDSAAESAQTETYYKSELGDGKWYCISDASSLADITGEGTVVSDEKIGSLRLTHHTKKDGKTYDLRSKKEVSVYDIISPYDLRGLPELRALAVRDSAGLKPGEFFDLEVEDEDTGELDRQMKVLTDLKERLQKTGLSDGQGEMLEQCIGRVDARRRHEVYKKVGKELSRLADDSGAGDSAMNEAVGECIRQVEDALLQTESNMLDEGETVMTAAETRLERELIAAAESGREEEAVKLLRSLQALSHIMNGVSEDPEEELRLLDKELIPGAEKLGAQNELDYYKEAKERLEKTDTASRQELSVLYDEKDALRTERLGALDDNDLKEAARLEAVIEAKDLKIQEKERELEEAALMQEDPEDLSAAGGAANVRGIKEEALLAIEEGDEGQVRLREAVEGIGALLDSHPKAAGDALRELYEKMAAECFLKEDNSYKDAMELTESLLAEHAGILDPEFDEEQMLEVLTEADEDLGAEALMGLSMYCRQTGRKAACRLLKNMAEAAAGREDLFVFPGLSGDAGGAYVSAETLAAFTSCRYLWNFNKKEATLTARKDYYRFQAFETIVERNGGKKETMEHPCRFRSVVYIPGSYVEQEFHVQIYELFGTGYYILADVSLQERAAEVCDALTEKGGE